MTEQEQKAFYAMREALKQIEWSNDSKWQSDCARQALDAANAVTSECSKVTSEYSEQPQDKAVKAAQASMAHYRKTMGKGHPQAVEPQSQGKA